MDRSTGLNVASAWLLVVPAMIAFGVNDLRLGTAVATCTATSVSRHTVNWAFGITDFGWVDRAVCFGGAVFFYLTRAPNTVFFALGVVLASVYINILGQATTWTMTTPGIWLTITHILATIMALSMIEVNCCP